MDYHYETGAFMKSNHYHLIASAVFSVLGILSDGSQPLSAQFPEPKFVLSIPPVDSNGRCLAEEELPGRVDPGKIHKGYQIGRQITPDSLVEPSRTISMVFDSAGNFRSISDSYIGEVTEILEAFQTDRSNAGILLRSRDDTTQVFSLMPQGPNSGAEYVGYLIIGETEEFMRFGREIKGGIGAGIDETKFQDRDFTPQDFKKASELSKWLWAKCSDGK